MIVGDCRVFGIESDITNALENPSQLALGFFVIHVGEQMFGVRKPDASLLGCSFNQVEHRLKRRGTHLFDMLTDVKAADVAVAYLDALYRDSPRTDYFGLSQQQFANTLQSSGSIWAPDGDEAFDDGSHILQFDVGSRVRIIAFSNTESPADLSSTIREEWMDADLFYTIVSDWKTLFTVDRSSRMKAKSLSMD
ncbi:Imm42 family immunity protein [Agrobacterium vitis]|uniref:Imm42 family immunity protein n=1 Tax=Agrobacterium vitis TaxID=373 RepID=UPI0012E93577|nr:Imm42 family immunity protein [Agrobacterium vitis]MVA23522.1 hypothetical protein [Agrobacterium vitis]